MIKGCKICGISDLNTLNYIINHSYPPQYVGFICNYKKSPRFVEIDKLKKLTETNKKKSKFVAVLVKPDEKILEKIKILKKKYKKKIIVAFNIKNFTDVKKYQLYRDVADIYLFDSKGYEKSMSFKHSLIENIKFDKEVMVAGNIGINDNLEKLNKIADIIDISGGLETSGFKDISKIEIFLNKLMKINDEN